MAHRSRQNKSHHLGRFGVDQRHGAEVGNAAEHQLEGVGNNAGPVAENGMGVDAQECIVHDGRMIHPRATRCPGFRR